MSDPNRPDHFRRHSWCVYRVLFLYAADTVAEGKYATDHVPANLRYLISAESASNDGLAYPFLSLSIFLTTQVSTSVAFADWILVGCLCKSKSIPNPHRSACSSHPLQIRSSWAP